MHLRRLQQGGADDSFCFCSCSFWVEVESSPSAMAVYTLPDIGLIMVCKDRRNAQVVARNSQGTQVDPAVRLPALVFSIVKNFIKKGSFRRTLVTHFLSKNLLRHRFKFQSNITCTTQKLQTAKLNINTRSHTGRNKAFEYMHKCWRSTIQK